MLKFITRSAARSFKGSNPNFKLIDLGAGQAKRWAVKVLCK